MNSSYIVPLSLALAVLGWGTQAGNLYTGNSATTVADPTALPAATDYRIINQDDNSRTWQRETYAPGPNGKVATQVHKVTEVASGMYYRDQDGQWQESQDLNEPAPGGSVARLGQYQVIFSNNLNTEGAIDLQTKDGKRLRSNILGLAYYDSSTGKSVVIAQIQDSQGQLIGDNQVLYPNAFDGAVSADVRYTYKRGSFEQDVILRSQPPSPAALHLNPATTTIEVMTEFINPPAATVKEHGPDFPGWKTNIDVSRWTSHQP